MKILINSLLLLTSSLFYSQYLTQIEAIEDLKQLEISLTKYHPDLYNYTTKKNFQKRLFSTRELCNDSISDQLFFTKVLEITNSIRDGHLIAIPSKRFVKNEDNKNNFLPFTVNIIDYKIFVQKSLSPSLNEWDIIKSINGKTASVILYDLLPQIPTDGFGITRKKNILAHNFSYLYSRFYKEQKFEIEIIPKKSNRNARKLSIEGVSKSSLRKLYKPEKIQFNIDESQKIAYFKIPSFNTLLKNHLPKSWSKYLKEQFKEISKKNIQNFILDLRNNEGGSLDNMISLAEYLSKNNFKLYRTIQVNKSTMVDTLDLFTQEFLESFKTNVDTNDHKWSMPFAINSHKPAQKAFKKELYILVNGGTFSSASHLTQILRDQGAIIVGEETGGNGYFSNAGFQVTSELQNSKIKLKIPLLHGEYFTKKPTSFHSGIIPDYNCTENLRDHIFYKDYCLLRILELIKEKENGDAEKK